MSFQEFVATGLPALGALIAIGVFLWKRYQGLETRFHAIERKLTDLEYTANLNRESTHNQSESRYRSLEDKITNLDHRTQMTREAMAGTDDMHILQINGNRELIQHRTDRFCKELKELEERLQREIDEIKRFLERTTEFTIRK